MSDGLTSTTVAYDGGRAIHFTDLVYDGDVVDVFETMEQAEADEGPSRKMRVVHDGDDWKLVAADVRASSPVPGEARS